MPNFDYPELTLWITSVGRIDTLPETIESWISKCTYPNYRFLIMHNYMNDVSLKFIKRKYLDEAATERYIDSLTSKFPHVKFDIIKQEFKILGKTYNQLMPLTGPYNLNLEDDFGTVCDPHPLIIEAINMMRNDPKLIGVRADLRDETVYDGCPRFPNTKESAGVKFCTRDAFSGGGQFVDTEKVRQIGGWIDEHPADICMTPERDMTEKMNTNGMYTGISLSTYGCIKHIGRHSVAGVSRIWTNYAYDDLVRNGWYGDGSNKKDRDHPCEYYVNNRYQWEWNS